MTRSAMLRKITKLLKTWEGCQLNGATSREILDLIEQEGMLPPPIECPLADGGKARLYSWEVQREKK